MSACVEEEAAETEKQRLAEREKELLERERQLREEQEQMAEEQRRKEQERIEEEKSLKAEKQRLAEKAAREHAEAEKAAMEKERAERIAREKEENEKRAKEQEEAAKLMKDNEILDRLKNELISTKSQEERRSILSGIDEPLNCESSKRRVEELRKKANQKQPQGSMINWIFGVTVILAIVVTGILGGTGNADSPLLVAAAIWYGLGIPVWIIWRIVLMVQSRSEKYCLNIKHI